MAARTWSPSITIYTAKKATAFGDDSLLFPEIIKAISENVGKGTEYNNDLIDDPGASIVGTNWKDQFNILKLHFKYRLWTMKSDQGGV